MTPLFKKLNLKDQKSIVVLNAPASFEPELEALEGVRIVRKLAPGARLEFGLGFAITQEELDRLSSALASAAEGDAVLWLAYPKGTSKKYKCEFNRDSGWSVLGNAGFEGVRAVAIDEDWSALRFRCVEHIKSRSRNPARAMSPAGERRTSQERE
jgi:hypothetical protein